MFDALRTRLQQKHRTMAYPAGPPPALPAGFVGRPVIAQGLATSQDFSACASACPTGAIGAEPSGEVSLDMGKCLFCGACQRACKDGTITFSKDYQLAAARREDLIVRPGPAKVSPARSELAAKLFSRSLKLRQVSAGGCGACEADSNVLGTLAWDMGRFGISFVASPRHADGLLITGPVTQNMKLALQKTYDAMPAPKIVIAVGACAISGGPYAGHAEQCGGAESVLKVDLFVPGCPPNPLTILEALLRLLGRVDPT
jgi:Ni,Fe-hydrogenase III small subunit/formate hydrogenlyase subunit 6/NADH:ubiquinone oxidoreductase subunit I